MFKKADVIIELPGENGRSVVLNESALSKHLLLIGRPGCGKSTQIIKMIRQIQEQMNHNEDKIVVFDPKGEFYSALGKGSGKEIVIGGNAESNYWNIFLELKLLGESERPSRAKAIAYGIIPDSAMGENKVFLEAARECLVGVILQLLSETDYSREAPSNQTLYDKICMAQSPEEIYEVVQNKKFKHLVSSLGEHTPERTRQNTFFVLRPALSRILLGDFSRPGNFSTYTFINTGGGETLFLEYDYAESESYGPVYALLIDLLIKEATSLKRKQKGKIYLILDEFASLPKVKEIINGLNTGRGCGLRIIAGFQGTESTLMDSSGHFDINLLASKKFGTNFIFNLNQLDLESKRRISESSGKSSEARWIENPDGTYGSVQANVIEPNDLDSLRTGEAFIKQAEDGRSNGRTYPYYRFLFKK